MLNAVVFVLLVGCSSTVTGHWYGATPPACFNMTPGHLYASNNTSIYPQMGPTPYSVDIGAVTTYTKGTPIKVKLTGAQYQGFLIQARKATGSDTVSIGTWVDIPQIAHVMKCTSKGDSLTHSNKTDKGEIELTWNPPNEDMGPIKFMVTIAKIHDVFWRNHKSAEIKPTGYPSIGTKPQAHTEGLIFAMITLWLMKYFVSA